jgi:hypothetical protein
VSLESEWRKHKSILRQAGWLYCSKDQTFPIWVSPQGSYEFELDLKDMCDRDFNEIMEMDVE